MNPYDVLGVAADATLHQIKTAYRQRAMQTHPDRGNDGAEFAEVARAYAVLSDPESRRRFDETGSIDEIPLQTLHQTMVTALAAILDGILQGVMRAGTPVARIDWVEQMRANVANNLAATTAALASQRKIMADMTIMLRRITRKDEGQNLFADVLRAKMAAIEPAMRQNDLNKRALERLAEELEHYDSEVEVLQAFQVMGFGPGAFNQSSSTDGNAIFAWGLRR